jgi:Cu/Ag efflux protein CusF
VKSKFLFSLLATLAPLPAASAKDCGCECCKGKEVCCCVAEPAAAKVPDMANRHPLRGVITAVYADRSSLMVKHEEIPGVMRAMTMLFKVDEATLKSAQKGQTITAMMSRERDEWWLHEVKVVAEPTR